MLGVILLGYGKSERFIRSFIDLNSKLNIDFFKNILSSSPNKVFLEISNNKKVIDFSIDVLKEYQISNDYIKSVVFVVENEKEIEKYKNLFKEVLITQGGKLRQTSVYKGLLKIKESKFFNEIKYILIHDLARPLINLKMIHNLLNIINQEDYDGLTLYVNPYDSIAFEFDKNLSYVDRNKILLIQTPQIFKKDIIIKCHELAKKEQDIFTDDISILEYYTYKIGYTYGHKFNIKITDFYDFIIVYNLINYLNNNNLYIEYMKGNI